MYKKILAVIVLILLVSGFYFFVEPEPAWYLFYVATAALLFLWVVFSQFGLKYYIFFLVVFFSLFYYTDAVLVFSLLRKFGFTVLLSSSIQFLLIVLVSIFCGFIASKLYEKK